MNTPADAPPTNKDEYLARFARNQRISGFGYETTTHLPCPFCAAKDFLNLPIYDSRTAAEKGAECAECKRSAKFVFTDLHGGGTDFECVQTGGDAPPDYLPPMRRI